MSYHRQFQAIPPDCRLLTLVQTDLRFDEMIAFLPSRLQSPIRRRLWDEAQRPFFEEIESLRRGNPGIERRYLGFGQEIYDLLDMLSASDDWNGLESADLAARAMNGVDTLPEQFQSSQGRPIRYTSPDDIAPIASWLTSFSQTDLSACVESWLASLPESHANYFVRQSELPDRRTQLWDDLQKLVRLYWDVAAHYEGMLVFFD